LLLVVVMEKMMGLGLKEMQVQLVVVLVISELVVKKLQYAGLLLLAVRCQRTLHTWGNI